MALLNFSSRGSLGQLNKNITRMGKALAKVSSAQRINSAADSAADLAISEKMREQIRSLGQDRQNVQNGSSMMRTAEGGAQRVVETLREMKRLAIDAANDSNTDEDRKTIQKRIDQLRSTINDVAVDTQFNGKRLLTGLYGASVNSVSYEEEYMAYNEPPKEFTMTPGRTYIKTVNADGTRTIIGKNNVEGMSSEFKPVSPNILQTANRLSGAGFISDVGFNGMNSTWNWASKYRSNVLKAQESFVNYFEDDTSPSDQQRVIRAFMHALNGTSATSSFAFDDAVNYCTGGKFASKNALVTKFMNDLNSSASYTDFLENCCGIDLTNADTGAITGSDAGSGSTKTAESIVPENSNPASWTVPTPGSYTTIDGLTVHWPTTGANGNPLSAAEQHIMAGLNSEWIQQSLNLLEETYGINFNEKDTTCKDIDLVFEDNSTGNALAYVTTSNPLQLTVNMHYYNDIDTTSEDGKLVPSSPMYYSAGYLDRTIAHEFTHAVMAANVRFPEYLPLYLMEGAAELTHGIDDLRASTMKNLLENPSHLNDILSRGITASQIQYGGTDVAQRDENYAAGYMLLRYLAKNGQDNVISKTPPVSGETGVQINFNGASNADGTALVFPDSFDGQGFCILCGACEQYVNIVFDKNKSVGEGTLETTWLTRTLRKDYVVGINGASNSNELAKALFEGIAGIQGRDTYNDIYVEDANGNKELVCVSIDLNHNLRIAKNPNYDPLDSDSAEYIFLKENSPELQFMERGTIEATGGAGSKDDAPAGNATQLLDDYGNEILDENGDPIPHVQAIKVDTDTTVKIWEPKGMETRTVTFLRGKPLVIHGGTQANQHNYFYINDMQTKALTAGKIFNATSEAQKTLETLIKTSDIERYNSLSDDPDKQNEWLDTLKAAENMSIDDISVTTVRDANIAIRVLDGALEYALDNATTLGAYLNRLETTETNITTTEENTIASESTIRDADMAKEMTEYTKSSILMQASQAMLAQANQNTAGILELLR